jgi:hypothetical protein
MTRLPDVARELLDTAKERLLLQLEDRGITPQKFFTYLALFFVLWAIYAAYFKAVLDMANYNPDHGGTPLTLSVWNVLKFMVVEGWPFAVVAFFCKSWRSADAARVALAAFVAAEILWCHRLGLNYCPAGLVLCAPLLASAAIGHALGAWRHRNASNRTAHRAGGRGAQRAS